jgi:hypothetical protein
VVWVVSLSTVKLIPHGLTARVHINGLRSLPEFGNRVRPLVQAVLYGHDAIHRTLYLNIFRREPDIPKLD